MHLHSLAEIGSISSEEIDFQKLFCVFSICPYYLPMEKTLRLKKE